MNRTFQVIDKLSTEISDAILVTNQENSEDQLFSQILASVTFGITQQCSNKIFQVCSLINISSILK